ncbi:uncharacterized protein LOC143925169 [Lithobates pipiens]
MTRDRNRTEKAARKLKQQLNSPKNHLPRIHSSSKMEPEELRSNNARPARADIEANSTDYVTVEEGEGLENKRHEWSEGDSEKKTVIVFSDPNTIPPWQDTIPVLISHRSPEEFIRVSADYNFSSIILWHSVKSEISLFHLERYLRIFCEKFGHEKVCVVITDLEDTKTAKEVEKEWSKGNYARCQLRILIQAERDGRNSPLRIEIPDKINALSDILQNAKDMSSSNMTFSKPKLKIGIFSRSDQEDYSWLVSLLRSDIFSDLVEDIRPYNISNVGFQQFKDKVQQCTFSILYHTITRGRINITDMGMSSLYDKELEYLHQRLGRDRVIVVLDDLRNSSDQEKTRIIQEQPSIGRLAKNLFLFSKEEKASDYTGCPPTFQEKRQLNAMMWNEDLGRDRVIVVLDDLRNSSDQEKTRIIQEQPSIGRLAKNLFLFSKEEKASDYTGCPPTFQEKRQLNAMMWNEDLDEQSAHSSQYTRKEKKISTKEQRSKPVQTSEAPTTKNAEPHHARDKLSAHSSQCTSTEKKNPIKEQRSKPVQTSEAPTTKNAEPHHAQG